MTTYTNLGIKKITTGDEAGTWGESTNTNFDYFDTSIVGYVAVTLPATGSSGSPNTLAIADFAASDGRNRVIEFVSAADLGGTAYVQITPDDFEGYYFIRNSLLGNRSLLLFQGTYNAARDYEIPNGKDVVVRCTGGGTTSYIYNILNNLQINSLYATGSVAVQPADGGTTAVVVAGAEGGIAGNPRFSFYDLVTLSSGATTSHSSFYSYPQTVAASFTLPSEYAFHAAGIALGAGATVTNQYGFYAANGLTAATTNYGFYSDLAASGTSRYNLYAAGTAPNYFGGNTIISVTDNTNAALRVTQLGTGNVLEIEDGTNPDATPIIVNNAGSVILGSTTQPVVGTVGSNKITVSGASAADASFLCYRTDVSAGPSTFTFGKTRGTSPLNSGDVIGRLEAAGRDATTAGGGDERTPAARIEFSTDGAVSLDSMPGKIAFQTTPSGSNTPVERMSINNAGTVTITTADINGGTIDATQIGNTSATSARFNFNSSSGTAVQVGGTDTGPTGGNFRITFEDIVTLSSNVSGIGSTHVSYNANPGTSASTTLAAYYGYLTYGIVKGAGATVTDQYGFIVGNSFTGATTNYAFYSNVAASGTSRYGFYAGGTAPNYFGGSTVISVTDNTNAALRVTQLGTGNALEIEDSTNVDASPFIVDATGTLIKGYTTAVPTVGITSIAYTPGIQGHLSGSIRGDVGLYTWSTNTTFATTLNFSRSNNASIGTYTAVASGTNLGDILWCGADGNSTGSEFAPAVRISGRCGGTVADGSVPGTLFIATTAVGGTNPTVRMTIDPQGFVGIGDSFVTPAKLLDIAGNNTGLTSADPVNTLRFTDTDTTTAANQPIGKIEFYNSDTGNAAVGAYILSSAVGASGGGTIRFGAAADAGAVAEVARIASTGLTVTLDTAGLGYGTGTGGTVTQATNRTTGVTLNKTNGAITLVSAAGTATWQSFTVTNSTVAATDVVVLSQKSGTDLYMLEVTAVAAGSFRISFATTGGTTTEQPVVNFAVIKAVTA